MSTGISLLDPSGKPTGPILNRWGLRVNVKLNSGGRMITRLDIEERVREWGLREDVVEKDYVIGWVLMGYWRG